MITIKIYERFGSFAEDKKGAQNIRINQIIPRIESGDDVTLDFTKVDDATQSFIHTLISDIIRKHGIESMDQVIFKNCNSKIGDIINIVFEYMQDSLDIDEEE